MISKSELRTKIIRERKLLNSEDLSTFICKNILNSDIYKNAKTIFAYYPMKYEVDISYLFKDKSKDWYLPKVVGSNMQFLKYYNGDELKKSEFGVFEPINSNEAESLPDLIIVPALCVDKNNYRLGYGKGFYDRFLSKIDKNSCKTLTPVFSKFILDTIPSDFNDQKVDYVISELN